MLYLDPKNDLTFKKVFGQHPHLLTSLLNALLLLKQGRVIEHVENLSAESSPMVPELGNHLMEVSCTDNSGACFLVTIQMLWTDNFKTRAQLNGPNACVKPPRQGSFHQNTIPVYALYFVTEAFQPDLNVFYHHYPSIKMEVTEQPIQGLEAVFIELAHFKLPATVEKQMALLWLRYFTEVAHGTPDAPDALLQNEETKQALNILQESALSPAEREEYDRYWDAIAKERTVRDELIRRAIMQVKKEELEKGVRSQKITTAVKMMAKGFDDATISEFIELSIPEIQTLRHTGTLD